MIFALAIIGFVITGVLSGVLAGLLGIGGGLITVPCLYYLFDLIGLPQAIRMHLAIGTSLAAMIFNTFSSTWSHNKKGAVIWQTVKMLAPTIIIGSLLGAFIARFLSGVILEIIFGLFAICIGVYMLRRKSLQEAPVAAIHSSYGLYFASIGIGAASNILGIGGGVFFVPLFMAYKMESKKAIGTGAATSFIITFIGAISYLILGLGETELGLTIGYIYLPAFIIVGFISFFTAPYGVKWAHQLPSSTLRKVLAVILMLVGISMMVF